MTSWMITRLDTRGRMTQSRKTGRVFVISSLFFLGSARSSRIVCLSLWSYLWEHSIKIFRYSFLDLKKDLSTLSQLSARRSIKILFLVFLNCFSSRTAIDNLSEHIESEFKQMKEKQCNNEQVTNQRPVFRSRDQNLTNQRPVMKQLLATALCILLSITCPKIEKVYWWEVMKPRGQMSKTHFCSHKIQKTCLIELYWCQA